MRNKLLIILLAGVFVFGLCSLVQAAKPRGDDGDFLGNGFPSGDHYNLIIHGKKDSYNCSTPETWQCSSDSAEFSIKYVCDTWCSSGICAQVFGNVINVPFEGSNIEIFMESGRKGPKGNPGATTLEVTDACSADFDGSPASFRLPKDEEGYAVYVRITGKPGDGTSATFNPPYVDPEYSYVEDVTGNNLLILLGLITDNGLAVINEDGIEVFRSESNTKGQGNKVPKATEITRLFMWEGTMCYFDPYIYDDSEPPQVIGNYCGVSFDDELCTNTETPESECADCVPHSLCCSESGGIYESCDLAGIEPCPIDTTSVTAFCREYGDNEDSQWIFNIADFIGLMTDLQNNNSYNIQVRFYPLPLDIDAQQAE